MYRFPTIAKINEDARIVVKQSKVDPTGIRHVELYALKYFWLIVILPKTLQFVVLFLFAAMLIISNRKTIVRQRLGLGIIFIMLGSAVHCFSILFQCVQGVIDVKRLLAAINTMSIWLVALTLYGACINAQFKFNDRRLIYRYTFMNYIILGIIYIVYLILPKNTISLGPLELSLSMADYLESGVSARFVGLFDTALGIGHFYCISAPLLVLYASENERHSALLSVITLFAGYFFVLQTNSRIGIVVCGVICVVAVSYIMCTSNEYKEIFFCIAIVLLLVLLVVAALNLSSITEYVIDLFNSRAGSNRARFQIYEQSLRMVMNESPLMGLGIKYTVVGNPAPLGSHCTYIGFLYKTGIIGAFFFLVGLFSIFEGCRKAFRKAGRTTCPVVVAMLYMIFLVFADLDASNIQICLAFSTWGIMSNPRFLAFSSKRNRIDSSLAGA